MSARVLSLAIVAALVAGLVVFVGNNSPASSLRSQHAEQARTAPHAVVAVTAEGKLFHDPACPYVHGPAERMTAKEAMDRGYTPCTRCMRQALR